MLIYHVGEADTTCIETLFELIFKHKLFGFTVESDHFFEILADPSSTFTTINDLFTKQIASWTFHCSTNRHNILLLSLESIQFLLHLSMVGFWRISIILRLGKNLTFESFINFGH